MGANLAIVITAKDMASAPMKGITGAIGGVVSGLGKIGLAGMGVQTLVGGVKGLGDALGIGLNSSLEIVQAQLNAFTKDGAASAAILADIRKEAASTPFAFQEMASATAALLPISKATGVGLMDLVRQAEILAASNPAQGLEGAAFSLKEAMSGDFVSIVERFNLPRQRLKELKEQGVPAMQAISTAMNEMGLDADLVSNMSKTASGRWSTFMDTIDTLRAKLSEGIFTFFSDQLVNVQTLLDANMPTLEAWAGMIGGTMSGALSTISGLLGDIVGEGGDLGVFADSIREMTGLDLTAVVNLQRTLGGVKDAVVALATTGNLGKFVENFKRLTGLDLGVFGPTAERVGKAVAAIGAAISEFVPEPLKAFVAGLFDGAKAAGDGADPMRILGDAVNGVSEAVEKAVGFIREHSVVQGLLVGVVTAGATAYALATAAAVAHSVATKATAVATGIMTAAQVALNIALTANPIGLIVVALAGLAAGITYVWHTNEGFRVAVTSAWEAIRGTAETVFRAIGDFAANMGATIGRNWDRVTTDARNAINAVIGFINNLISAWNGLELRIPGFEIELPSVEVLGERIGGGRLGWGGVTISTPDLSMIPVLDAGAIVRRPTLAMLALSRPEAVVPLGGGGRGMGAVNVTVNVAGSVVSERDLTRLIRDSLIGLGRSNLSVGLS